MKTGLFRWLVSTVAVWIAASIVRGISYEDWRDILIAALVLGILNTSVRPILRLVSLPFIVLSFGLFLVVINALLLKLTTLIVKGFHVNGFWPAVGGSVVISIISMFLGYSGPPRHIVVNGPPPPPFDPGAAPPGKGPIIDV